MNSSELKKFFEENPLSVKAAASLKEGREIGLQVTGNAPNQYFTFKKENGRNALLESKAAKPDFVFTIPEAAAQELVGKNFDTVGQVGLHIFEKMLSNDPNQKIRAKLEVGILSLVTGGYFGVLTAGGADVAKFLATRGLGNMGKLKEAISKLRG